MTRLTVQSIFSILAFATFFFSSFSLDAQDKMPIRLSIGASAGYAPKVTYGATENTGMVVGVFGELAYGKAIGRLQYTKPILSTFEENKNRDGGNAYHGSLGYRVEASEKVAIALLLSGGATVVRYNNGIGNSKGDEFINVSPQVGVNIAPSYQISGPLSLQANLRYYKGFEAGDRGRASDLADISIGLRFTL